MENKTIRHLIQFAKFDTASETESMYSIFQNIKHSIEVLLPALLTWNTLEPFSFSFCFCVSLFLCVSMSLSVCMQVNIIQRFGHTKKSFYY